MKRIVVILAAIIYVAVFGLNRADAGASTVGIVITPTIKQINLTQSQQSAIYQEQVTNHLPYTVTIGISAEDFSSLNQNGGIHFISDTQTDAGNPHGLVNNLSLGQTQIVLAPNQTAFVPVTINRIDSLAAGGHYAAILFALQPVLSPKGNHVMVNEGLASLLFVATYGNGTQMLRVTNSLPGSFTANFPKSMIVVLQNDGNTQSTPRGVVQIIDSSHHVVSQGQLNVNSGLVLPQSNGLFSVPMNQVTDRLWPGIYTARVVYSHDGQAGYSISEQRFLYISKPVIATIVIIILLVMVYILRKFAPRKMLYSIKR
ncbi:MAG TPA: hypothetical protein VGS08_02805 [Candidatus Saccharimonadales bacterium]|nr:hypothetical protein [Candidatus Saccharimonadales bacterium]